MTAARPVRQATGLAWVSLTALAALAAMASAPASAMAVAGPGGTAEQGRRLVLEAPAAGAVAPTLDLVAARLEAVDLAAGTVTVRGQRLPLHAAQLRVLGNGGQLLGPRSLRAGQAVRLALEPAAPAVPAVAASAPVAAAPGAIPAAPARRIVLIYIDG